MLVHALLLLVASVTALASDISTADTNYCEVCKDHTLCIYPGVSDACLLGHFVEGVDAGAKEALLAAHNSLRNRIASGAESQGSPGPQPSASNMLKLEWDDELAKIAQRWSNQCAFGHDACRNLPGTYVGQNAFKTSSTGMDEEPNWAYVVQGWYDEVGGFNSADVENYRGGSGHYTQVVWATTAKVGCGFTLYDTDKWRNKYYICNYGPGGNLIGGSVYERGPPRAQCPSTPVDSNYPALC